jgi:hypothetical protein
MPTHLALYTRSGLPPSAEGGWLSLDFEVRAGTHSLYLWVHLESTERRARIDALLSDPQQFRGFTMTQAGQARLEIHSDQASPGAVGGPLPAGRWQLDLELLNALPHDQITVEVRTDSAWRPTQIFQLHHPQPVIRPQAGWYSGELHAHSNHSTGRYPVARVVQAAAEQGLDFLSLTDHNTCTGWYELDQAQPDWPVALIRGCEWTTGLGHANLHGLRRLDLAYPTSLEQVIEDTHQQGGLFCVNHAFSNNAGWQHPYTDWTQVDLLEIYHHLEYTHNPLQWGLWDRLLDQGYAVVGVAGTDSKNPLEGHQQLGRVRTWVYAPELSAQGILQGLKAGRVYASLGPRLEFWASSGGKRIEMHESAPLHQTVDFHISLTGAEPPVVVYLLRNGLFWQAQVLHSSAGELTFTDLPQNPGFYRLEVHRLPQQAHNGYDRRQRSWDTFLAASNPIFVGGCKSAGRWKDSPSTGG